ncbi:MAG: hypothetical protein KA297_00460 [Kofleriaceae bacterium]|nr:hypothetical protein [Kofleriaceae bacterium]
MADHRDDDEPLGGASPSPGVLAAFRDQATPALYLAAHRFARQWAKLPRRAGRRVDHLYARELVQDALADTWSGTLRWDPARRSLLHHVRNAIRWRAWNDARHARRFQHVPWNTAANDEASARIEVEVHDATNTQTDAGPLILVGLIVTLAAELRRLATGDDEANAILDCWAEGVVERDEVMARTHLSAAQYKAARRRLLYLVKRLPPELREAAGDILRSAS